MKTPRLATKRCKGKITGRVIYLCVIARAGGPDRLDADDKREGSRVMFVQISIITNRSFRVAPSALQIVDSRITRFIASRDNALQRCRGGTSPRGNQARKQTMRHRFVCDFSSPNSGNLISSVQTGKQKSLFRLAPCWVLVQSLYVRSGCESASARLLSPGFGSGPTAIFSFFFCFPSASNTGRLSNSLTSRGIVSHNLMLPLITRQPTQDEQKMNLPLPFSELTKFSAPRTKKEIICLRNPQTRAKEQREGSKIGSVLSITRGSAMKKRVNFHRKGGLTLIRCPRTDSVAA